MSRPRPRARRTTVTTTEEEEEDKKKKKKRAIRSEPILIRPRAPSIAPRDAAARVARPQQQQQQQQQQQKEGGCATVRRRTLTRAVRRAIGLSPSPPPPPPPPPPLWRYYEKRDPKANGAPSDEQNVYEREEFLKGQKHVAIISDAASSGISLHAERNLERCKNAHRRRVGTPLPPPPPPPKVCNPGGGGGHPGFKVTP